MIFNRLLVREKLNLLAVVPVIAITVITVPLVANQVQDARESNATAERMNAAARVGGIVQDLERERLLAVAYLAVPDGRLGPLSAQAEQVRDDIAKAREQIGGTLTQQLSNELNALGNLDAIRGQVRDRSITARNLNSEYAGTITKLIDAVRLSGGSQERALRALLLGGERNNSAVAELVGVISAPDSANSSAQVIASTVAVGQIHQREFRQLADPAQVELLDQVDRGAVAKRAGSLQNQFIADPVRFASADTAATLAGQVFSVVDAQLGLRRLVQDKIINDLATASNASAARAATVATVFTSLAIALVIAILTLSVGIGRSVSRPLRRLTTLADRVAEIANEELVRVADEEDERQSAPRLAAVTVESSDEIGELASAMNRVQAVAALLLERQVASRRNVAVMFGNVGRRTQNLVGRQLSLIDSMERSEQDAELLKRLYRLDHLTTRLRRNANSLLVLSGSTEQQLEERPQPVVDLVRAALGEIEDFQRVKIDTFDDVRLRPEVTGDFALMIAELLENATAFSPPTTQVDVTSTLVARGAGGCQVLVIDRGIGMSEQQLEQENQRLLRRERLDIAPTDVLGLFVVGRLCRRHGIDVMLRPTPEGGITAEILIPERFLIIDATGPQPKLPKEQAVKAVDRSDESAAEVTTQLPAIGAIPPVEPEPEPEVVDTQGLTRRVRGAQLPESERINRPTWSAESPEAARELIEQFESGVERAGPAPRVEESTPDQSGAAAGPAPQPELRRRVRGAQLPESPRTANPGWATTDSPEAARELVDLFESGVRRADEEAGRWVEEFRRSTVNALDALAAKAAGSGAEQNGSAMSTWFSPDEDEQPIKQPPAAAGASGLTRRVRGASLPKDVVKAAGAPARPVVRRQEDPESARGLVLDFESGEARAKREIGNTEGTNP